MAGPTYDRDLARRLRSEGWKLTDIAVRVGAHPAAISRACRGVVCPVNHYWTPAQQVAFHAERERQRVKADPRRGRARQLRRQGLTLQAIASLLSLSHVRVHAYVFDLRRGPHRTKAERRMEPEDAVPSWAAAAGLRDDYRDFAADFGPEFAARECRRLKAEASA